MPSINFVASYNAAKLLGANVYLADVDKYTGQMRPKDVENCCKKFGIKSYVDNLESHYLKKLI